MMRSFAAAVLLGLLAVSSGCGRNAAPLPAVGLQSTGDSASGTPSEADLRTDISATNLFAISDYAPIAEYAQGKKSPFRKIGDDGANTMALDRHGNLYGGYGGLPGVIKGYAPGHSKPFRTITIPPGYVYPVAFAFNGANHLFVATECACSGTVDEYAPTGSSPIRTITDGVDKPYHVAVDRSGNVYVLNEQGAGSVTVYAPGKTTVTRSLEVERPFTMAFSKAGNLFVANWGGYSRPAYIGIYASGQRKASRTITLGSYHAPSGIAFDRSNNVYVLDFAGQKPEVEVFQGNGKPLRTITEGLSEPVALAVDPANDDVYVSNDSRQYGNDGWISVYAHGSTKVRYKITQGLDTPDQLMFSN